jgi:hypothetical protein
MSEPIRGQKELLREALGPTSECPPLDVLAAPRQDAQTKRHAQECPHCRAELALLHQFESAEARPGEAADLAWIESELARRSPVAARSPEFFGRLRAWFEFLFSPAGRGRLSLAVASVVLLVTAGLVMRPGGGVRQGITEEPAVWRSGQFAATSPAGDLDQPPSQLRWEAVPGAASYHVRLLEVDGAEIWSADSTSTSVAFPGNIASQLTRGRAFQWDATSRNGAGRQLATTNLQTFHIVGTRH